MPQRGLASRFLFIKGAGPLAAAGQIIMAQVVSARGPAPVHSRIDALVAEHGAWTVLARALRALVVRPVRNQPSSVNALDDRLLRDIGLPPRPPTMRDWHDLR
jgi:hypothetical protein